MAMITLASASGAPGVTTTGLALAACWPRPCLLVEADPSGSSALLAGFWRGTRDHTGVVDLVKAHRAGVLADALLRMAMPVDGTQASVIIGSRSHEQAAGLARLWEPLAGVLRDLAARDQDVIVDAGRLGLEGSPAPLIDQADVTLLVVRTSLVDVAGARSWALSLQDAAGPGHEVRLLLVGPGRPYSAGEVSRALGVAVAGSIRWDPVRAAVFSHGDPMPAARGFRRLSGSPDVAGRAFAVSGYQRSVQAAGEALRSIVERSDRDRARWIAPHTSGEEARP
jgi:hypothetical protein